MICWCVKFGTHRQTPWTDNVSSLFVFFSTYKNMLIMVESLDMSRIYIALQGIPSTACVHHKQ